MVWMTLSHIDNDDTFLNSEFKPSSVAKSNTLSPTEQKKQIDQDYLIALSIEEEEKKQAAQHAAQLADPFRGVKDCSLTADEFLARKLQEEEDLREVQEYERNRAVELHNRKLNMQPRKEFDGSRQPLDYNERFPPQFQYPNQNPAAGHSSPPDRHSLNRTESSDSRPNAEYSRNKPSNLHPNLNSTTPSENHTQSSSSSRGAHHRNNHHSSNHGHHKKNVSRSSLSDCSLMDCSLSELIANSRPFLFPLKCVIS